MSQHFFDTYDPMGLPIRVMAGWDRPLGHFFLVIEHDDEDRDDSDDGGIYYSNLDDPAAGLEQLESFDYFREKLAELHINVPPAMLEAVEQDQADGVGNRVKDWTHRD